MDEGRWTLAAGFPVQNSGYEDNDVPTFWLLVYDTY